MDQTQWTRAHVGSFDGGVLADFSRTDDLLIVLVNNGSSSYITQAFLMQDGSVELRPWMTATGEQLDSFGNPILNIVGIDHVDGPVVALLSGSAVYTSFNGSPFTIVVGDADPSMGVRLYFAQSQQTNLNVMYVKEGSNKLSFSGNQSVTIPSSGDVIHYSIFSVNNNLFGDTVSWVITTDGAKMSIGEEEFDLPGYFGSNSVTAVTKDSVNSDSMFVFSTTNQCQ